MTKRRRSAYVNQLTGGTGDVNPQFLHFQASTAVADTCITRSTNSPISKGLMETRGKATILEILKVMIQLPSYPAIAAAAETVDYRHVAIGSQDYGATNVYNNNPTTILVHVDTNHAAFTAGGSYMSYQNDSLVYDLTDGAGHGILYAADTIFIQVDTGGFGITADYNIKILYRYKTVTLQEYIGIVQSQQ